MTVPLSPFERVIARTMLAGVWLSTACLAAGLALLLGLGRASDGNRLLGAGLIVLMATPLLRVAMSVGEALRRRDWFWLWTTVAVAGILAGTLIYSYRQL